MNEPALYGLLAEFPSADSLCAAARHVREHGYTRVEAYSPFAIAKKRWEHSAFASAKTAWPFPISI